MFADAGLWGVYLATDPDRVDRAREMVIAELKDLAANRLPKSEIDGVKSGLKGNIMLGLESVSSRMMRLGRMEVYLGRYQTLEDVSRQIDAVTPRRVHDLVNNMLEDDNLITTIVQPEPAKSQSPSCRQGREERQWCQATLSVTADKPHSLKVSIRRLPHAPVDLPVYATAGAAGMDIRYAGEDFTLEPGARTALPTGFCIALPEGFEAQIRLRSGFALRTGLLLINAPGTVDSDYRGEIKVLILNPGPSSVAIARGERFAQLVIAPVARCTWEEVEILPETQRNSGGFGSTGSA